jgi:hypothetical protein
MKHSEAVALLARHGIKTEPLASGYHATCGNKTLNWRMSWCGNVVRTTVYNAEKNRTFKYVITKGEANQGKKVREFIHSAYRKQWSFSTHRIMAGPDIAMGLKLTARIRIYKTPTGLSAVAYKPEHMPIVEALYEGRMPPEAFFDWAQDEGLLSQELLITTSQE